jgi:hypothetical protein
VYAGSDAKRAWQAHPQSWAHQQPDENGRDGISTDPRASCNLIKLLSYVRPSLLRKADSLYGQSPPVKAADVSLAGSRIKTALHTDSDLD